jgi:hypothetical protein
MKLRYLFIGAAILAANVWMVSSAQALQQAGRAWLILPSFYDARMVYHPTTIRAYYDQYQSAADQCTADLKRVGDRYPWSLCTVNLDTVRLFSRLY